MIYRVSGLGCSEVSYSKAFGPKGLTIQGLVGIGLHIQSCG